MHIQQNTTEEVISFQKYPYNYRAKQNKTATKDQACFNRTNGAFLTKFITKAEDEKWWSNLTNFAF